MNAFSQILKNGPEYENIALDLKMGRFPFGVLGLPPATKSLLIHTLCEDTDRGALVVWPDEAAALRCRDDLTTLGTQAVYYPARDLNFYGAESSSREYEQMRIAALFAALNDEKCVMVCSAEALSQRTIPPDVLRDRSFTLRRGEEITTEDVRRRLIAAGYTFAELVEGPGQFSLRGGILDIFPPNAGTPVRIEFWGDEIDTVSAFDVLTQRRTEELDAVTLTPCTEILFENSGALIEKLEALKSGLRGKSAAAARQNIEKDIALLEADLPPSAPDKYLPLAYGQYATALDYFTDSLLLINESFTVKEKLTDADKLRAEETKALYTEGVLCRGLDGYALDFSKILNAYSYEDYTFLSVDQPDLPPGLGLPGQEVRQGGPRTGHRHFPRVCLGLHLRPDTPVRPHPHQVFPGHGLPARGEIHAFEHLFPRRGIRRALVEGHDDGCSSQPAQFSGVFEKGCFAFLERDAVDDGLALNASQGRADDLPVGGVYHERHPADIRLGSQQIQEMAHLGTGVDESVVHVDVQHESSVFHLLSGDAYCFLVVLLLNQTQELAGASHVASFADVDEPDLRGEVEGFETGEGQRAGRHLALV